MKYVAYRDSKASECSVSVARADANMVELKLCGRSKGSHAATQLNKMFYFNFFAFRNENLEEKTYKNVKVTY